MSLGSFSQAWWPIFLIGTAGCAARVVAPPPASVTVVPVSFESNLLASQQCEFRGIASSVDEARKEGANLVLTFTDDMQDMQGRAVSCPQESIARILNTPQTGRPQ